jgi:hypothetical protein
VSALIERLISEGAPDDLLAPVMIVLAIVTALTGLLLCGLGLARAGAAIRFVPYPVIGGFLGATGWLMISGAVRVITDHPLSFATLEALIEPHTLAKLAAGGAVALALYLALRRARSPFVLPGILLAGIAVAHLAFTLTGVTLAEARADGWTFKAPAAVGLTRTWDLTDLRMFPWRALPALSGDILAVMFVTAITMLLNTAGIEFVNMLADDLNHALETCEKEVIAAHLAKDARGRSLREWFTQALGSADLAEQLTAAASGSKCAKTTLSPRRATPPIACISFSKGASASWSSSTTAAPFACAASGRTPRSAKWGSLPGRRAAPPFRPSWTACSTRSASRLTSASNPRTARCTRPCLAM